MHTTWHDKVDTLIWLLCTTFFKFLEDEKEAKWFDMSFYIHIYIYI